MDGKDDASCDLQSDGTLLKGNEFLFTVAEFLSLAYIVFTVIVNPRLAQAMRIRFERAPA